MSMTTGDLGPTEFALDVEASIRQGQRDRQAESDRDRFARAALAGMSIPILGPKDHDSGLAQEVASTAYLIADAMIFEREDSRRLRG